MDFFDLLGLKPHYPPDAALLRRRYLARAQASHPDRHSQADDLTANASQGLTAHLNQAYQTLRNAESALEYLFRSHGVLRDGQPEAQLSPAFLMEMMEWNERVEVAEGHPEQVVALEKELEALMAHNQAELASLLKPLSDESNYEKRAQILKTSLPLYLQRKYLLRIRESLRNFVAR